MRSLFIVVVVCAAESKRSWHNIEAMLEAFEDDVEESNNVSGKGVEHITEALTQETNNTLGAPDRVPAGVWLKTVPLVLKRFPGNNEAGFFGKLEARIYVKELVVFNLGVDWRSAVFLMRVACPAGETPPRQLRLKLTDPNIPAPSESMRTLTFTEVQEFIGNKKANESEKGYHAYMRKNRDCDLAVAALSQLDSGDIWYSKQVSINMVVGGLLRKVAKFFASSLTPEEDPQPKGEPQTWPAELLDADRVVDEMSFNYLSVHRGLKIAKPKILQFPVQ